MRERSPMGAPGVVDWVRKQRIAGGEAFNRSMARESAASPQNVQITTRMCDSEQTRVRRKR